jgi:putative lipoic acid-binding regulatory protein
MTPTTASALRMTPPDAPAGSFFHPVPNEDDDDDDDVHVSNDKVSEEVLGKLEEMELPLAPSPPAVSDDTTLDEFDDKVSQLIKQRRKEPLARQPSTIDGVPTEKATGFGKAKPTKGKKTKASKPYVAIGPTGAAFAQRINDPTKPEVDDQGYTLYTDEETGEKSRVFEALVEYPCVFTMKIVGANEGSFVTDILAVVADATESEVDDISHSTKAMGKWTSVTVQAPVQSSEMLYTLYEKVDLDPRVKFKF